MFICWQTVGICCPITHGRKQWIHSSKGSYNLVQLEMNVPSFQIKPSKRQSGATKQGSNSLVHNAELWTNRLGCLPFFSEWDRINSKLVYAVPKINLIQKGSRGQSHHLPCPLRQIIAKIVSTLCTQELKLETLTIQYTKGFCCLVPRTVLLSASVEEDGSWQVEATELLLAITWSWCAGGDVCQE